MKFVIEFYRTRCRDNAHAVVGREMNEAIDIEDAIRLARDLAHTLDMPQRPDAMTITDQAGNHLYSAPLDNAGILKGTVDNEST